VARKLIRRSSGDCTHQIAFRTMSGPWRDAAGRQGARAASCVAPIPALAMAAALALLWPGREAQALCTPAAPVSNTTVTCSLTTTNQNNPNGYGTFTENNLIINIQSGASVSGTGVGGHGISVLDNNTINNSGTVSGAVNGVNGHSALSVTNFGSITGTASGVTTTVGIVTIDNRSGATITGTAVDSTGITGAGGVIVTGNAGTISGGASAITAAAGDANVTNSATGTITTGGGAAIVTQGSSTTTLALSNSGTVSNTGTGIALQANGAINVTSNSGKIISGGTAITNSSAATITVNNTGTGIIQGGTNNSAISTSVGTVILANAGMISSTGNSAVGGNIVNITSNSGTISEANATLGAVFASGSATITNTNNITATGAGSFAIFGSGAATVTVTSNSGHITATGASSIGILAGGITVTNNASGMISGDSDGINQQRNTATSITNAGMISGAGRSGLRLAGNATVVNTGTITGLAGIVFRDPNGGGAPTNGSVFNSGIITGTGGTAINFLGTPGAGPMTLTLGPGSVINDNVLGTSADTFQLGGTGSDTFNLSNIGAAQQYRGFTTFNKIGGSTWTVTGTFAQTNAWTVQGGTLLVDGDLSAANNVTVNASGTLRGTGTLSMTNINGGTLAPGHNGIGTLAVNGSLTLQSASLYLFGVNATASGRTTVTGATALAGTAQAVFQGSSFQSQYTILSAAGGRAGTFGNFVVTNLPAFITASLIYTPTEVDLKLTSGLSQITGLTGNQAAVSAALDRAINSGGGFLTGLAGVAPGQLPAALNALSGEGLSGTQETASGAGGTFLTAMMEQAVHELDPSRAIAASFITLPGASFTVEGPRAARDAARIDAGSKLAISRTVSLFDSFDGEFSARSRMYAGKGGVLVEW
jgi:hypothetical protein